jgi:hypothetical protein
MFYLSCEQNSVCVWITDKDRRHITTYNELIELLREFNQKEVMCSSSMDFPEENTTKKEIISLCEEINDRSRGAWEC